MLHINKVAEQTGVTTRTLRYYDQIDLLKPATLTEGGHRLYSQDELKKLQQIQFLKRMSFSLQEIKEMLTDNKWDWSVSLKNQLLSIIKEQEQLKKIEKELYELVNGLAIDGKENMVALQKLIQLSNKDREICKEFRKTMFSNRELDLWSKLPRMEGDDPESLEWIALLGQIKRYMKDGPETVRVQRIIRRMEEKRLEEFDREDEFINKLWEIRKSSIQSEKIGLYPIEDEVLEFMDSAYEIYTSTIEDTQDIRRHKT